MLAFQKTSAVPAASLICKAFGQQVPNSWRYFVRRVVILGRAAAGKTTLSLQLSEIERLPVVELDKLFWRCGTIATPRQQWIAIQEELVTEESWILDGDLGNHDAVGTRLSAADTIILLDFSFFRCAWQACKRSREGLRFWIWMASYRWRNLPPLVEAIAQHAPDAEVHVFQTPRALARFVDELTTGFEANHFRAELIDPSPEL